MAANEGLSGLTAAETEALIALYQHRYLVHAAAAIGISPSGVRARLESATKRTGMARWPLAKLVSENASAPSRQHDPPCYNDPGLDQQLSAGPTAGLILPPSAPDAVLRLEEERPRFDHGPVRPAALPLPKLTRNGADGNGLTTGRRVAAILAWCLIGIMLFCLLIATLAAVGTLGLHLQAHGVSAI